jgi:hypothetical protein
MSVTVKNSNNVQIAQGKDISQTQQSETTNRCDKDKLTPGDFFSRLSYGVIVKIVGDSVHVRNSEGREWSIGADLVAAEFSIAGQHDETIKVTQTEMIQVLLDARRTAMTVNFNKKPDAAEAAEALSGGKDGMTDRQWKAKVKLALEGEERTAIGYHEGNLDERGRLKFYENGKGFRQVDPRTLNWVVVNRKLYEIK